MSTIHVVLPYHLLNLARVDSTDQVEVEVDPPVTVSGVIDALELGYPALRGTVREYGSKRRRPFVRIFACGEDISHEPIDTELPDAIVHGDEPLQIVGAIAGG